MPSIFSSIIIFKKNYLVSISFLSKLQIKHFPSISFTKACLSSLNSPKVSKIIPKIIWIKSMLKIIKKVKSKKYLPQNKEGSS